MDILNRAYAQLYDLFRSMTPGSRLSAGLLLAVVAISMGYLFTHQAAAPDVDLLQGRSITESQLRTMTNAFDKAQLTTYAVRGKSIFVPQNDEVLYRNALGDTNALCLDVGMEEQEAIEKVSIFDIGSQKERDQMRIAKERRLGAEICQIRGIERAQVHYDVDNKPGGLKDKTATASVVVKPAAGFQLDAKTVSAIQSLVAHAYAGLKPEMVAVTDTNSCRTWDGPLEDIDAAANEPFNARKRAYEQDLRSSIHGILGYIPGVTIGVSTVFGAAHPGQATADKPESAGAAITLVKVAVNVPVSYLKKIWLERCPVEEGKPPKTADPAAIQQIRAETSAEIKQSVAQLLPPIEGIVDPTDLVAVTFFEDLPTKELPSPTWDQDALGWLRQHGGMVALVGLALLSLLLLRSIVRAAMPDVRAASLSTSAATAMDAPPTNDGSAASIPKPSPRRTGTSALTTHDELSEIVRQDPNAAANVLRTWTSNSRPAMSDETTNQTAGIRKAAILAASLDPLAAETVLNQLTPEEARHVGEAVAQLGQIDAGEQQRIVDKFLRVVRMAPDASQTGIELDAPLIAQRFPITTQDAAAEPHGRRSTFPKRTRHERFASSLDAETGVEAAADNGLPFGFLTEAEDEKLAGLLQSERPQTVALVLSQLPSQRAGGVLARFPPNLQVEIVRRLVALDETDPAVLEEVGRALETRLSEQFAVQRRRVAGMEAAAAILEACDSRTQGRLLENLAACDRSLAEKLGLRSMTFDDLASLRDMVLATIFRAAESSLVQTALLGASPQFVERVLGALPPREAKRLRKHLANPGPLRLSDVDDARRQIAAAAQRMLKKPMKPASAA